MTAIKKVPVKLGEGSVVLCDRWVGLICDEIKKFKPHGDLLNPVVIGDHCEVGMNNIIYAGTSIGDHSIIENFCEIGSACQIGRWVRVCYHSQIGEFSSISDHCIIAGFVCDHTTIGEGSRIFGSLVHKPTLFTGPAENDWRAANLGVESRC